jgi:hypothetical protein
VVKGRVIDTYTEHTMFGQNGDQGPCRPRYLREDVSCLVVSSPAKNCALCTDLSSSTVRAALQSLGKILCLFRWSLILSVDRVKQYRISSGLLAYSRHGKQFHAFFISCRCTPLVEVACERPLTQCFSVAEYKYTSDLCTSY